GFWLRLGSRGLHDPVCCHRHVHPIAAGDDCVMTASAPTPRRKIGRSERQFGMIAHMVKQHRNRARAGSAPRRGWHTSAIRLRSQVIIVLVVLVLVALSLLGYWAEVRKIVAAPSGHRAKKAPSAASLVTATPIKYVVVIFQENESFDHYFGTYPHAENRPG